MKSNHSLIPTESMLFGSYPRASGDVNVLRECFEEDAIIYERSGTRGCALMVAIVVFISLLFYALYQHGHAQYVEKAMATSSSDERVAEIVEAVDPRVEVLRQYFVGYDSVLADHAAAFVETADQHGLDWRLLPAIASQESGFGKKTPSCAPYNPFGWISTTSPCGFWRFNSFDEAIRTVGSKIATMGAYADYRRTGSLQDISKVYNGGDQEAWARHVSFFREKIK